jgi:hypothetical protein
LAVAALPGALTLAKALSLAAEVVLCAKLLTCALYTNVSAIEAVPAKTANDLFMVFSWSVPAQV